MAGITLDAATCVRAVSKFSTCNRCDAICPTEAIKVGEGLPSVNLGDCVGCGGCVGVCPSEAVKLDDFNSTEFFFSFMDEKENLVSCRKNVPCISVLNVEHVIAMATLKNGIVFDMGHCEGCDIAHKCRPQIEELAEETNYILGAMEHEAEVALENVEFEPKEEKEEGERRSFFRAFNLKNALKSKKDFERKVETSTDERLEHEVQNTHVARIRNKELGDKRKILFTALKRVEKPSVYHVIDANEVSFTSQKLLDEESCTACQMCYRICPTGALSSNAKNSKIDFDPFLCIKCQLCHDVCEPDSITLSPSYNMKEFFEPTVQNLVTFKVRNCNECGTPYAVIGGSPLCHRCRIEEEEARELWGIEEDY
ncbi:MAG: 4Fe-4S binding protein [Sulfurimonadaceae bacterium]|nr:4Fe-4S binding protein [Sulfurimonadaceae bacterium]